jgi:hypothetical protein
MFDVLDHHQDAVARRPIENVIHETGACFLSVRTLGKDVLQNAAALGEHLRERRAVIGILAAAASVEHTRAGFEYVPRELRDQAGLSHAGRALDYREAPGTRTGPLPRVRQPTQLL